ncbi:MAG: hypothetical protein HQL33_07605 [Alphaproteobacteria bacterium]|nr:hypothetical protein [Alphaproteobacteria bacterium]MBF0129843.1 hypothetical protein [Alphaproteobacteria bacterium]
MTVKVDEMAAVGSDSSVRIVVEDEEYTVVSLCDRLSLAQDSAAYVSECCAPCPSYTTVPCSC